METTNAREAALDEFEKRREEKREIVQICQQERGLTSCFVCDKTFQCDNRTQYVNAAYMSMSKGESGGFAF
jgi:hypothetical protein